MVLTLGVYDSIKILNVYKIVSIDIFMYTMCGVDACRVALLCCSHTATDSAFWYAWVYYDILKH